MRKSNYIIEEVTDPDELARAQKQAERHRINSEWLASHWDELLPQARGKFVAVAGQQSFIAETAGKAWSWAESTHPEDDGAIVSYIPIEEGPRIYIDHR